MLSKNAEYFYIFVIMIRLSSSRTEYVWKESFRITASVEAPMQSFLAKYSGSLRL